MSDASTTRQPPLPDWLDFDYSPYFAKAWSELGFSEDDRRALEQELFTGALHAPVEPGTGGLRKIRIARPGMGKRGGARVGFAYFPRYRAILVVTVFAKNNQATLTPAQKKAVKQTLLRYEEHLKNLSGMTRKRTAESRMAIERHRRQMEQQ